MSHKTIDVHHEGGMRFVATTGSGHAVAADSGIGDTGPRPTELVLAGLATCTAMDVASIMGKKRQVVDSYTIHVEADQRAGHPDTFTRIVIVHEVVGPDVSEQQLRRSIELSATKYCPVSAMLAAGETVLHHRYRIRRTGVQPFEAEGEVLATGPHWQSLEGS